MEEYLGVGKMADISKIPIQRALTFMISSEVSKALFSNNSSDA